MPRNSTIRYSGSHPTLLTWPYRLWCEQARRLYPTSPAQQQRAILEHLGIAMHCTTSPERWLWLATIGARLVEETAVQP